MLFSLNHSNSEARDVTRVSELEFQIGKVLHFKFTRSSEILTSEDNWNAALFNHRIIHPTQFHTTGFTEGWNLNFHQTSNICVGCWDIHSM